MFKKLLQGHTYDDVVESTYLVSRILRHLSAAPVEQLLEATARQEKTTATQRRLIKEIIRTIEEKEKLRLQDFDEARSSRYIKLLSKTVLDRAHADLKTDKKTGANLLKELRAFSLPKQAKL